MTNPWEHYIVEMWELDGILYTERAAFEKALDAFNAAHPELREKYIEDLKRCMADLNADLKKRERLP